MTRRPNDPGGHVGNPYAPPSDAPRPPTPDPRPPQPPHPLPGPPVPPRPGDPELTGVRPPSPDPVAARAASKQVLLFGLLLLATIVTGTLPLPWQAGSLGFAVAALVMGICALRSVRRAGVRGAIVPLLAVGLAFTAVLSLGTVGLLALWPVQLDRQHCLQDALTISANDKCQSDFLRALQDYQHTLEGQLRAPTKAKAAA